MVSNYGQLLVCDVFFLISPDDVSASYEPIPPSLPYDVDFLHITNCPSVKIRNSLLMPLFLPLVPQYTTDELNLTCRDDLHMHTKYCTLAFSTLSGVQKRNDYVLLLTDIIETLRTTSTHPTPEGTSWPL